MIIMETQPFKTKPVYRKISGSLSTLLMAFDLPILIEKMKSTPAWTHGELNAMVLMKGPVKKIVLTALHAGTEIKSFQSDDSVTFQIIEGKLKFHTDRGSVILDKGQLLLLQEKTDYSLTTKEDTVLLLTIAKGTFQRD